MRTSGIRRLPGFAQPLESKLTDRLEHRQPRRSIGRILSPHQAVVYERRAFLEPVTGVVWSCIEQHGGIVQAAAANEDGKASEHRLLTRFEQVVAPRDGMTQALVPDGPIAAVCLQQVEPTIQPRQHGPWREQLDAGGCQLDRQRQPIEPCADLDDRVSVIANGDVRADGEGAIDEQRRRGIAAQRARRIEVAWGRMRQRRNRIFLFTGDLQRDTARDHDGQAFTFGEQRSHCRSNSHDMLEVVEQQQQPTMAEE